MDFGWILDGFWMGRNSGHSLGSAGLAEGARVILLWGFEGGWALRRKSVFLPPLCSCCILLVLVFKLTL